MSYNIVKQFSGAASRLKNYADAKLLAIYALYSYGLAATMTGNSSKGYRYTSKFAVGKEKLCN